MHRPKSKFILEKIRSIPFSRGVEYLEDLLRLEGYVLQPPQHIGSGWDFQQLCRRYPAEHDAIRDELTPAWREKERRAREARNARTGSAVARSRPPPRGSGRRIACCGSTSAGRWIGSVPPRCERFGRTTVLPEWVKDEDDDYLRSIAEEAFTARTLGIDVFQADKVPPCRALLVAAETALSVLSDQRAARALRCRQGERAFRKFTEAKERARPRRSRTR